MRNIILASASKPRAKILKNLGLKFKVMPSFIKENRKISSNCPNLVKANALKKAEAVAKRLDQGIVIGADTLVLANSGQIIGKPKNMEQAKRTLKLLSKKTQWVYTGLAVIDLEQNKKITDYEKTKVYMNPLSDEEIKRYFLKNPPLNKAGGFDIERGGSIFIRRIEGCFYNVVGLPVAKLHQMLKKIGKAIL